VLKSPIPREQAEQQAETDAVSLGYAFGAPVGPAVGATKRFHAAAFSTYCDYFAHDPYIVYAGGGVWHPHRLQHLRGLPQRPDR
jgi:hypothetical protein